MNHPCEFADERLPANFPLASVDQVEAIYLRFAPNKLGKVVGLLARYAGNEEKLLRLVRRKYVDAGKCGEQHREDVA